MVKVSALAPYPSPAPSTYFRLEQFVEPFAARGIDLEIHPFVAPEHYGRLYDSGRAARARLLIEGWRRRLSAIEDEELASVVIVQRELAPLGGGRLLAGLVETRKTLVFDFDDAVYLKSPGGEPLLRWMRDPETETAAICRAAAAVWPGNEELARFAIPKTRGVTSVVPTVVDTSVYRARNEQPAAKPVVGWVGSHTSLPYLESLFPVLGELTARVDFTLRVVCNRPPSSTPPQIDLEFETWTPARRVEAVQAFDIGLYPVADDPWTRGKCGLKAIEYGACGVPVVCPPVGVLSDVVTDDVTGLHVHDESDWCHHLERLIRDGDLRRRLGRGGRARVEERYSVASVVDRLADNLRALERSVR